MYLRTTPEGVVFLFVHKNGMFRVREHEKDVNKRDLEITSDLYPTLFLINSANVAVDGNAEAFPLL